MKTVPGALQPGIIDVFIPSTAHVCSNTYIATIRQQLWTVDDSIQTTVLLFSNTCMVSAVILREKREEISIQSRVFPGATDFRPMESVTAPPYRQRYFSGQAFPDQDDNSRPIGRLHPCTYSSE